MTHFNLTSKKGFFFVLATLIVLSYILASITLWTKSMEAAERAYAERFRLSNLELASSQVSPVSLQKFAEISVYHALYTINDYSSMPGQTLRSEGDPAHRYDHVIASFASMVENNTLYERDFENYDATSTKTFNPVSDPNAADRSLKKWAEMLNASIQQSGLSVKDVKLTSFKIKESDTVYGQLDYEMKVRVVLVDTANPGIGEKAFISKEYLVIGKVLIDGMTDPAVFRETKLTSGIGVVKQFFFNRDYKTGDLKYETPKNLNPVALTLPVEEGQGWFYGPVIDVNDVAALASLKPELRRFYILSGAYSDMTALVYMGDFGAFIQTDSPPKTTSSCTHLQVIDTVFNAVICDIQGNLELQTTFFDKPYVVAPNFDPANYKQAYYDSLDPEIKGAFNDARVLIVSDYSPQDVQNDLELKFSGGKIYDMEDLRDFTVCGYYVHNKKAPSYFDRLFADPFSSSNLPADNPRGIETFVFGSWTDGNFNGYTTAPSLSKLDREFFDLVPGSSKVRGMPGCKNVFDCSFDNSPIGPFRLIGSTSALEYLGGSSTKADDYLLCKDEGCEAK
jgi:hypothetical protein